MLNNYTKLESGVIRQIEVSDIIIEKDPTYYVNYYNNIKDKSIKLNQIRLDYINKVLGKFTFDSILDVGYGNGDFLELCNSHSYDCYGYDISSFATLDKDIVIINDIDLFTMRFDIITMFDALEHFKDIDWIKELDCKYIVISVPYCHYFSDEWFENWKHRKPNEHIYHFNLESLTKHFENCGYEFVNSSNIEDEVRTPVDENQNILTAIFKKV
jgi:hypothetical protein